MSDAGDTGDTGDDTARAETAPMQFEGDGPGIFVRGSDAFPCGVALATLLKQHGDALMDEHRSALTDLRDVLLSVDAEDDEEAVQKLKAFAEALRPEG